MWGRCPGSPPPPSGRSRTVPAAASEDIVHTCRPALQAPRVTHLPDACSQACACACRCLAAGHAASPASSVDKVLETCGPHLQLLQHEALAGASGRTARSTKSLSLPPSGIRACHKFCSLQGLGLLEFCGPHLQLLQREALAGAAGDALLARLLSRARHLAAAGAEQRRRAAEPQPLRPVRVRP